VLVRSGTSLKGVPEAVRAGASVHQWSTPHDLAILVHSIGAALSHDQGDATVLEALVGDLHPRACADVLMKCVTLAHRHLDVVSLAIELRTSRRSLSRRLHAARWPAPAELIEWGRLIRASVVQWRGHGSAPALARAAGFATPASLRHAMRRRIGVEGIAILELTPLRVSAALRRRVPKVAKQSLLHMPARKPVEELPHGGAHK
jgi:AraC-like DNA-binding protein